MGFDLDLDHIFSYHPATEEQVKQYEAIRAAGKAFSEVILANSPTCPDQTVAVRCIREAVMNANSAIALNGRIYKES